MAGVVGMEAMVELVGVSWEKRHSPLGGDGASGAGKASIWGGWGVG